MILQEKSLYRESDLRRAESKGICLSKRMHLEVRCDQCDRIWLVIKNSYKKSKSYHDNNHLNKDLCKSCRTKLDYSLGIRSKKREPINDTNTLSEGLVTKRRIPLKTSNGYIRSWTLDRKHPRLNINKRDKNPKGGRVYEHILVIEKRLGRYLTLEEKVHHINLKKDDNHSSNLHLVRDAKHHQDIHRKLEEFTSKLICEGCIKLDTVEEEFFIDVSALITAYGK